MIPELVRGGHRVIAVDHIGMGRCDKPLDVKYHSFDNHVNRLEIFKDHHRIPDASHFLQDDKS